MSSWNDEEDWLIDSLSRYESLHMYELQQPTKCMEWTRNGTAVCVAGFSKEHMNEVVQLALPEKLLPPEHQTLWAKRDFKIINGGFSKCPVTSIKYIATANLIATAGSEASVSLWAGDTVNSDMLVEAEEISIPLKLTIARGILLDWSPAHPTRLLAGRSLAGVRLVDIHSKKILYEVNVKPDSPSPGNHDLHDSQSLGNQELHGLCFAGQDTSVFVTCSGGGGQLNLWDPRTPGADQAVLTTSLPGEADKVVATEPWQAVPVGEPAVEIRGSVRGEMDDWQRTSASTAKNTRQLDQSKEDHTPSSASPKDDSHRTMAMSSEVPSHSATPAPPPSLYALAVSCDGYPHSRCAVAKSSERGGGVVMFDTRRVQSPVASCSMVRLREAMRRFAGDRLHSRPCVQFSPRNSHRLSLSGVLEGVSLYDTATWSAAMEAPPPLFTHQGHEQENPGSILLHHTWCPTPGHTPYPTLLSADSEGSLHAWQWKGDRNHSSAES